MIFYQTHLILESWYQMMENVIMIRDRAKK